MDNQKKPATLGKLDTRGNKPNRKHNLIFVGHHHAQDNTMIVNKTLQTTGGKEHSFMWKW